MRTPLSIALVMLALLATAPAQNLPTGIINDTIVGGFSNPCKDDIAGLSTLYPTRTNPTLSAVTGRVLRNGVTPVFGAHVVLQDALSGAATTGGVTLPDGTFSIGGVPSGLYHMLIEPLDGPMTPGSLAGGVWGSATMDQNFRTQFFGQTPAPSALVQVPPSGSAAVGTVSVAGSAPAFNLVGIALTPAPNAFSGYSSVGAGLTPPYTQYVAVGGPNLAAIPDSAFTIDSPFVTLTSR